MTLNIDTSTDFGQRVARRPAEDQMVWFFWDGQAAVIYSQPNTPKVRNISQRPRVSLSFNSTESGGDVVILTGDAWIDEEAPAGNDHPEYLAKYAEGLVGVGMTPEEMAREYSVAIRVRPTSLRGG